ncbi:MAG: YitT family protein [Chitinophagaceae bacterium]|nr:YitT family protein [Chitinophagaceae bacterium]
MNPQFQQIIIDATLGSTKKSPNQPEPNKYQIAKAVYRFKQLVKFYLKDAFLMVIGIFAAGFGLKSFLLPNNFIDGGATGISLLITEVTNISLAIIILVVNIPFVILAYKQIGSVFTIKTILAISGLALCIAFVQYPIVTNDKLLVSVFGGFFLGAGIGFAMRGGAVLDGTEVLAIYLSRKTSTSIGDIIIIVNVIIFAIAAKILGIDAALYSMLTYLAASKTIDFLIEGIEEYTGVTIISPKSEEISMMITEKMGRGITVYAGKGGYGKKGYHSTDMSILYTVITRLEISRLKNEIGLIDPNAFVIMNSIKDTKGGMIKKRPLKEDH